MKIVKKIVLLPLMLYQRVISPLLPARCNYYPSCSEYTRQALEAHGVVRGVIMGALRIGRCSAFFFGGYDPVPSEWALGTLVQEYRDRSVRRWRRSGGTGPEDRASPETGEPRDPEE
ncbi:membrane protein insertion efficiency factor YidD [Alkalispirochaeta alkalica]|uniref:membrane protein insertion efficiency factor YidD n=1 Tax=Alkalispirochaeta alkalica TaxID=46356 RepID=UPI00037D967D|nr:membrane protein insertion efficiency factor YidD [Alkalispirochaeta alkalica]